MTPPPVKSPNLLVARSLGPKVVLFALTSVFLGNLNALVDHFLHPEIPYFDEEHLIVGGLTFIISVLLFTMLILYEIRLNWALSRTLESFLPICAACKKIRKPDAPAENPDSWQRLEFYISERMDTQFSHGLCPECLESTLADLENQPL